MKIVSLVLLFSLLEILTACSSEPRHESSRPYQEAPRYTQQAPRHMAQLGRVSDIQIITTEARTSGGGAILGAVLGGVVGHQLGGGKGRDLATGLGAVGGAIAGNSVERRNKNTNEIYRVTVSLNNGRSQQFDYQEIDDLRVGDKVKIEDGQISPY
jgi:outer membrane lipoprotein SlyB